MDVRCFAHALFLWRRGYVNIALVFKSWGEMLLLLYKWKQCLHDVERKRGRPEKASSAFVRDWSGSDVLWKRFIFHYSILSSQFVDVACKETFGRPDFGRFLFGICCWGKQWGLGTSKKSCNFCSKIEGDVGRGSPQDRCTHGRRIGDEKESLHHATSAI